MASLIVAVTAFAALHLLVSGTPLREHLVGRVGERAYLAAFSVASAVLLGAMILAYLRVQVPTPSVDGALRTILVGVNVASMVLITLGVTTPAPTLAGGERLLRAGAAPRGIHHVTRHPFLWGMALWSVAHVVANPAPVHAVFFGGFALVALAGTVSIDHKRAHKHGEDWAAYRRQTSNLPFAAILQGRTGWGGREWLDWRPLAAAAAAALASAFHGTLAGLPL